MLQQETLISAVKAQCQADERIKAALMYGSFTQNCGDAFSDVEFYIFVANESFEDFDTKAWIAGIYPLSLHLFNDYGTEVVVFENLVRGEFHFLPQKSMDIIESFRTVGYFPDLDAMCLYDESGELKKHLAVLGAYEPKRDTTENIHSTIDNLINQWLMGVNVLKRGEAARSLECLTQAQKYHLQLIRLQEGSVDHWVNPTKRVEEEISPESYQAYANCTAALDRESLSRAYFNLLKNVDRLQVWFTRQFQTRDYSALIGKLHDYFLKQQH